VSDPALTPAELAACERLGRADWLAASTEDRRQGITEADLIGYHVLMAERAKLDPPIEPTDWTDVPL
jgi:hypothetical protein